MTPISIQPTTPGITAPLTTMSPASQSPAFWHDVFTPQVAKANSGRPKKITIFRGNQYSQSTASLNTSLPPPRKRHQNKLKHPKRGYTSKFSIPQSIPRRNVEFKSGESITCKPARIPRGMRLLDVEILAQAMTKLKCPKCSWYLSLWES